MRVVHIITGLDIGGAELALTRLLQTMDRCQFDSQVISLTGAGEVAGRIRQLGIPVWMLGMNPAFPNPLVLLRLALHLKKIRPDVIQTWMYHADLVGGIAAWLAGGIPVIWGIRNSILAPGDSKRLTIAIVKILARLSHHLPRRIVSCSEIARQVHIRQGYAPEKFVVIPNGFDLEMFYPNEPSRLAVRRELGLSPDVPLIGLVARFDPYKDHRNFVEAAAILHRRRPDVHFLLCGGGITWDNPSLSGWIRDFSLQPLFHLLGRRTDIPYLTAALDIAASSSYAEAFPNVVGEAMACGVPCVVTDVGDSALIVGNTGRVVPPKDPAALADACQDVLELSPENHRKLSLAARQRVIQQFNLQVMARHYEQLYLTDWGKVKESSDL